MTMPCPLCVAYPDGVDPGCWTWDGTGVIRHMHLPDDFEPAPRRCPDCGRDAVLAVGGVDVCGACVERQLAGWATAQDGTVPECLTGVGPGPDGFDF